MTLASCNAIFCFQVVAREDNFSETVKWCIAFLLANKRKAVHRQQTMWAMGLRCDGGYKRGTTVKNPRVRTYNFAGLPS